MKARIFILCLFACAALLFVWPAAFAAPTPAHELAVTLTEAVVTQIVPIPTAAVIWITEQGLQPSQVRIQPGGVVTWTNQTTVTQRLVSGDLRRIFLPLVLRNAGGAVISTGLASNAATGVAAPPRGGYPPAPPPPRRWVVDDPCLHARSNRV
jgi:hypothetical protein